MKLSHFYFTAAMVPSVLADFWMVYQRRFEQVGRMEFASYGTSFWAEPPQWDCRHNGFSAWSHTIVPDQRNASETRTGVQFEPWNSRAGPLWYEPLVDITMNFYPSGLGIQTISHDDNYVMRNANGEESGQCWLNRTYVFEFDCWYTHPDPRVEQWHVNLNGSTMFFCESEIHAPDIYPWAKSLQGRDPVILPPTISAISPKSQ
ncbi:hypothetical protein GGR55DRAFT_694537 [Xylaria sp. FL0064]|nr:hypothetical protein GGR55DRAFT_694537 [Xylaria sp. FL0064]